MSQTVRFEGVLIWSHRAPGLPELEDRQYKAFNRVFDDEPNYEKLAGMVAEKQLDIEANGHAYPDPQMHRLEVRRVETTVADLAAIVSEWNAGQDDE